MSPFEWSTTVLGGVTAVVGLASLIFLARQVRLNAVEIRNAAAAEQAERIRQRKRETTVAVIETIRYRQELKNALPWNDRDASTVEAFLNEAENDEHKLQAVRAYLDYVEMLAASANESVLDVGMLERMQGGRILAIANNYSGYIRRRRAELDSPTLYTELEALAKEIGRRRSER